MKCHHKCLPQNVCSGCGCTSSGWECLSFEICPLELLKSTTASSEAMGMFNSLRPSDAYTCVSKLTVIGSDNGLSPDRRQAIIWTNAGILLIGPLGTNFSEISIEILTFSFKKMGLKVSSAKGRPLCLGLNVLSLGCPSVGLSNQIFLSC